LAVGNGNEVTPEAEGRKTWGSADFEGGFGEVEGIGIDRRGRIGGGKMEKASS
jgi:hypothetical protein